MKRREEKRKEKEEEWGRDLGVASAIIREEESPWLTDEEKDECEDEQHKEGEAENAVKKDHRHPRWVPEREREGWVRGGIARMPL